MKPPICPECGGETIIWEPNSGEVVCGECGLVISQFALNTGPEWRAFNKSERDTRSRVGVPISFSSFDMGLTTMIGPDNRDYYGNKIPLETRIRMFRLRRRNRSSRVNSGVDRNIAEAMAELDKMTDSLHIPSMVKEKASVIYRKALKKNLVRGRSIAEIAAASLYAACRVAGTPRTLKDIAIYSIKDKSEIAKSYRLLLRELNLHMPVPKASLLLPKIASKLGVCEMIQHKAVEILREAKRLKATAGKDPKGLAAAALYLACVMNDERITQDMIADVAGVTSVTIRNRYKELKEVLELDVSRSHPKRKLYHGRVRMQTSPAPYLTNLFPSTTARDTKPSKLLDTLNV